MVVNLEGKTEHSLPKKWQGNPERRKTNTETSEQKVPVIYYLSRNGQVEHPHFMEVPLSSPQGLYLKDVISRLSFIRGQGISSMYSWSSKSYINPSIKSLISFFLHFLVNQTCGILPFRSYKNGFVWQDLSENDLIEPCQGHEYILKGSQLLQTSLSFRSYETSSSSSSSASVFSRETNSSSAPATTIIRRKNQSWSLFDDLREYQVYKAKTTGELPVKAADASTQTDEKATNHGEVLQEFGGNGVGLTEQSREEASMGSNYGFVDGLGSMEASVEMQGHTGENNRGCEKMKASRVLMQLIRCGSRSVKDCESDEK